MTQFEHFPQRTSAVAKSTAGASAQSNSKLPGARATQVNEDSRPLSISQRLGQLQFHKSGKFRVLQLADIQDGPKVSADTVSLIRASLAAARPDVVIFSGNQIAGYDKAYANTFRNRRWESNAPAHPSEDERKRMQADLERTRNLVRHSIQQFVQPLIDAGVPWAVTFGNHDFQCGLTNQELNGIYREFEGCLNPDDLDSESSVLVKTGTLGLPNQPAYACEAGTFALPVADEQGKGVILGIVLVDSGDYARAGGYGSPSTRAMKFLAQVPGVLGQGVQSMVFQHTPLPQFYELLRPVEPNAAHAIEGYRSFSGQYYALDESKNEPGGYVGEGVSCPDRDSGEFKVMKDTGAYFALSAGHDHRNAFCGQVDGIRLLATPTCGFGSYGPVPAKRAARLFEFDIRHPFEPRTQLLEFGDLVGKPTSKKAYVYGMTAASQPESEGMDLLHQPSKLSKLMNKVFKLFKR